MERKEEKQMDLHVAGNILTLSIEIPYLVVIIIIIIVIALLRRR